MIVKYTNLVIKFFFEVFTIICGRHAKPRLSGWACDLLIFYTMKMLNIYSIVVHKIQKKYFFITIEFFF